jgi:ATP-dependent protease ClpP protease subunit
MESQLTALDFVNPSIQLAGIIDYGLYEIFRSQLASASQDVVIITLSTLGGDPEVARIMGEDIRYMSEVHPNKRYVFLGKTAIYSAGVTFMSFFARSNRYVTRGTRLMIHERIISKKLKLDGPLTTCVDIVKATLNEIECSIKIQNEGFANLVNGSSVTLDQVLLNAPKNWYVDANEALTMGLIEQVI